MKTVRVCVDGIAVDLPEGVNAVAALMEARIACTRRSVSGEWRFAFCGMGVCQECRVNIDGRPHQLACRIRCAEGMRITTGEPE